MPGALEARFERLIAGDGDEAQALSGCAWAIIRNGRIAASDAVGYANPLTRRHLRADAPMRVASISKLATTILILQQVDAGRIGIDDDVSETLGFSLRNPAFPSAPVTVRLLLSHRSSMRDGAVYWGALGERLSDFFAPGGVRWEDGAHWDEAQPPGAYFKYCNLGFGVLATLVEKLEGKRFDIVAHESLLHPLGLDSGFNWSGSEDAYIARGAPLWQPENGAWAAQLDEPLPVGRAPLFLNPNELPLAGYSIGENGLLFSPQGGLRASVRDLARIGALLIGHSAPFLSAQSLALMQTQSWRFDGANGDDENGFWRAYAHGMQIIAADDPACPIANLRRSLVGHSGDAYGLRGGLFLDPQARSGFAFLFNGGPADDVRARGARSGFLRSEEAALGALYDAAVRG
ncbi:MAG: serine hydrolase domain-containing protein [Hyphomonadaceae bacterium]